MSEMSDPISVMAQVRERNSADSLLRTAQQHHVHLSAMADMKANIIITVSSIVLTLALARIGDPALQLPLLILVGFTLMALLLAILAVLPKYRPMRLHDDQLPARFNLLFFGHFAELSRARFVDEMARTLSSEGGCYTAWAHDIHSLGSYLAHHKYRYLRLSYLFFLGGFVFATLVQGWRMLA